ncbi:hypothetical protein (mitochondrion) [Oryza sativa Japonica Group]|uniref:Uncharacterized protein n=2 Tax=Oryza sativa TaxID=4530 RepID=A0A8D5K064_ORYSI|nr:unnamed protein product [Oryza sativa]BCM88164.1 hypothetical protein [Oryza sativa Indica Group]|eukprot:NP_044338.1 hypothetical protein (mitochondrion) [Oryza sativa Japonica Group]
MPKTLTKTFVPVFLSGMTSLSCRHSVPQLPQLLGCSESSRTPARHPPGNARGCFKKRVMWVPIILGLVPRHQANPIPFRW